MNAGALSLGGGAGVIWSQGASVSNIEAPLAFCFAKGLLSGFLQEAL